MNNIEPGQIWRTVPSYQSSCEDWQGPHYVVVVTNDSSINMIFYARVGHDSSKELNGSAPTAFRRNYTPATQSPFSIEKHQHDCHELHLDLARDLRRKELNSIFCVIKFHLGFCMGKAHSMAIATNEGMKNELILNLNKINEKLEELWDKI